MDVSTEAGRRLLADAEYEDEGEWVVACYNETLPDRIKRIEAEARADGRLEQAFDEIRRATQTYEMGQADARADLARRIEERVAAAPRVPYRGIAGAGPTLSTVLAIIREEADRDA